MISCDGYPYILIYFGEISYFYYICFSGTSLTRIIAHNGHEVQTTNTGAAYLVCI
jgi:hypothetical protein